MVYHWRRKWQSTPEFLPGEFHGQGSLMGHSPWGHKESARQSTQHIIIFVRSSVSGHFGCFHVLTIVNSAAVNFGVHVSLNYNFVGINAQVWDH